MHVDPQKRFGDLYAKNIYICELNEQCAPIDK